MRSRLLVLTLMSGLLFAPGSYAAHENAARDAAGASSAAGAQAMTAGLVKKVDRNLGKVTISHEPIENLGMPKMTMVFRVKDPAMLEQLKEGDKIRFVAEKVKGAFTVIHVEPAK